MATAPTSVRGRYRKAGYYKLPDGTEVVGLKRRPDGRFYAAAHPTKTFGKDPDKAVFAFNGWNTKSRRILPDYEIIGENLPADPESREEAVQFIEQVYAEAEERVQEKLQFARSYARKLILRHSAVAAREFGIPQLAWLRDLKPPEPSPTLQHLCDFYLEKKYMTKNERSGTKIFWKHFMDTVGVTTVRELTREIITDYNDKTTAQLHLPGNDRKSTSWVRHRFTKVNTILRFAKERNVGRDDAIKALEYCEILEVPAISGFKAQPIEPNDFQKALSVGNDQDRALLLLALNCAMYAHEISYCERGWIKLDQKAFVGYRYKHKQKPVPRVAALWDRTIDAIKKLSVHEAKTLFISKKGTPWSAKQIQRRFADLRRKAGLTNHVEFSHIRDGAYDLMYDLKPQHAKMVAGHHIGVEDHYLTRHAKKVADVCAAIERYYFSQDEVAAAG